jgi:hypothetical protein
VLTGPCGSDQPGIPPRRSFRRARSRGYDDVASRIWIECSGHNREVLVSPSGLLCAIKKPFPAAGPLPVFHPKLRHLGVIREVISERGCESQGPAVVESSDED